MAFQQGQAPPPPLRGRLGRIQRLPTAIRHLGPWTGSREGEVGSLRLAYRVMLAEQGFVEHARPEVRMMDECPQRNGKARVPMHHGLRDKDCPRCGGLGWVRPKP